MKRFIDIGANLTDPMYKGLYHGSKKHEPDLLNVLGRAWEAGLKKIIITGGNLEDCKSALDLARTDDRLFSTVGCHPTRCQEFEDNPREYLENLEKLITENEGKVVAAGEFGLDYDRLHFCPKDIQKKYFKEQLNLFSKFKLPLFLHCRNACENFISIISEFKGLKGVVHSFDGSLSEAEQCLRLGFYIGINGCSLKTEDNLKVAKSIPKHRLLIETDAPWCEIKPTHAGFKFVKTQLPSVKKEKWNATSLVKGRNEPCNIRQVLEILAGIKDEDENVLAECIYENTERLFFYN